MVDKRAQEKTVRSAYTARRKVVGRRSSGLEENWVKKKGIKTVGR